MVDYPQMPPLTQDELDTFFNQPLVAKLCSRNQDGSIHIAPIWFKYDNGEFLLGTQDVTRKVHNVGHNPSVTMLIDDPNPPFKGVVIYGTATLDYEGAVEKRAAIFAKYMPAERATGFASALANKWNPVIIRVKPERLVSFDYSKGSLV